MAEMADHRLTDQQRRTIRDVLAPYADRIAWVGLFGSRATGAARPNSDVDLVLYGAVDEATCDRIWSAFQSSHLALTVDVVAYDRIDHPPLKDHIDRVVTRLFTQADLRDETQPDAPTVTAPPERGP